MLTTHVPVVYTRLLGGAGHDDLAAFLSLPQDRRQEALRRALASVPDAPGSYWPAGTPADILARLSAGGNKIGRLPYIDSFFVKLEQALDLKKTVVSVLKSARGIEQALDFNDLHTAQALSSLINPGEDVIEALGEALDKPGLWWPLTMGKGPVERTSSGKYRVQTTDEVLNHPLDGKHELRFERALRYLFPERTIAGLLDLDFLAGTEEVTTIDFATEEDARAAAALIEGAVVEAAQIRVQKKELTKWGDHTAFAARLPYRLIIVTRLDYSECPSIIWSTKDQRSFIGTDPKSIVEELFGKDHYDESNWHTVTPRTGVYVLPTDSFIAMTYDFQFPVRRMESFILSKSLLQDVPDTVLLQRLQDRYSSLHVWPSILYVGEGLESSKDVIVAAVDGSGTLTRKTSDHPVLRIPYDIVVIADVTFRFTTNHIAFGDRHTLFAVPNTRPTKNVAFEGVTFRPDTYVVLANGEKWVLLTSGSSRFWRDRPGFYPSFLENPETPWPHRSFHSNIIDCLHEAYNNKYEWHPDVNATDLESFSVTIDSGLDHISYSGGNIGAVSRVRLSKATNSVSFTKDFQWTENVQNLGVRQIPGARSFHSVECVIAEDEGTSSGWIPLNMIVRKPEPTDEDTLLLIIAGMIACRKEEGRRSPRR